MEDYIRGIVCGYLTVQKGSKDNAKRTRMFLVMFESRIDYYTVDPRPKFDIDIADSYLLTTETTVNHYVELNAKAPPHSFCLTTDRSTDVYIADTDAEAQLWFHGMRERLDGISSMVSGSLLLRKEFSVKQQVQRALLHTKYRWKDRSVELGRTALRYCKESERRTKTMKQFTLTGQTVVSEEGVEYLKQRKIWASYATPVQPAAKELKALQLHNNNPALPQPSISAAYPFVLSTGQTYLVLAAPSQQARTDWIFAIRMRVIALKHRRQDSNQQEPTFYLSGVMEVQLKAGKPWKPLFVELDNNRLRVKRSERKVGSLFETQLIPTCTIKATLMKANAFELRNLGWTISLAPGSIKGFQRWTNVLQQAARSVSKEHTLKIFEDDAREILNRSVVYNLDVTEGMKSGLVVERYKRRIFLLSHKPVVKPISARRSSIASIKLPLKSPPESDTTDVPTTESLVIPEGSVLVGVYQFGILYESFENIWHKLRQKEVQQQHPMTLTFRVPTFKQGKLGVKLNLKSRWKLHHCCLQFGKLVIETLDNPKRLLIELPMRYCQIELFQDEPSINCIKITMSGRENHDTIVYLDVPIDCDSFLWFTLLVLEADIAQDSTRFRLTAGNLKTPPTAPSPSGPEEDQKRALRKCTVAKELISEIENEAQEGESKKPYATQDRKSDAYTTAMDQSPPPKDSRQLCESDTDLFFQYLDVYGCGKVSSSKLFSTLEWLTRHVTKTTDETAGPLQGIRAVVDELNGANSGLSYISHTDFGRVMQQVTDATVVDLIQKLCRHHIQCM